MRVGFAAALFVIVTSTSAFAQDAPITHIDTDDLVIALTLDDGYRPSDEVMDYLETEDIPGTAFIVGTVAEEDPDFVQRIDDMGWMVCSHTYQHRILTRLSASEIREEIVRGQDAIEEVVGYRCPYFRAPGGAVNDEVIEITTELGLQVIGWDASLSDSTDGVAESDQLRVVRNDLHPGTILLGHFGGVHTYSVLTQLLEDLENDGYRILSVEDLLNGPPPPTPEPEAAFAMPDVEITVVPTDDRTIDWRRIGIASAPGGVILIVTGIFSLLTRRSARRRLRSASI